MLAGSAFIIRTKKAILFRTFLLVSFLLLTLSILSTPGSANDINVEESDEAYNKIVEPEGKAVFEWTIHNLQDVSVNVTIEIDTMMKQDWDAYLSDIRFELPPQSDPNSSKTVNLTITTTSDFDGEKMTCKVTFTTDTSAQSKVTTTKLDIPEEDKELIFMGYKIPLPSSLRTMWGHFLASLGIWIIIAILSHILLKIVIPRLTKKTTTEVDDDLVKAVNTPLFVIIILYGLVESLKYLEMSTSIIRRIRILYDFTVILMIVLMSYRLFRVLMLYASERWSKKGGNKIKSTLMPLMDKLGKAIIFIVTIMLLLDFFGVDLTVFVAGAGIAGLVIAFAAQETLANFFSGIFLIMEPKFNQGDMLLMNDEIYEVKEIGLRSTQLYNVIQHMDMIIPNQLLASSQLINLSQPDRKLRMKVRIPVGYNTDVGRLEDMMKEISEKHTDIITGIASYEPLLYFDKYSASSLDFVFMFWINNFYRKWEIQHRVLRDINTMLRKEGIEIPYDKKVITLKTMEPMGPLGVINGTEKGRTGKKSGKSPSKGARNSKKRPSRRNK